MNFIIEVIKKNPDSKDLVYVVRVSNGAPIAVVDSPDDALSVIQKSIDKALSVTDKSA